MSKPSVIEVCAGSGAAQPRPCVSRMRSLRAKLAKCRVRRRAANIRFYRVCRIQGLKI